MILPEPSALVLTRTDPEQGRGIQGRRQDPSTLEVRTPLLESPLFVLCGFGGVRGGRGKGWCFSFLHHPVSAYFSSPSYLFSFVS